MRNRNIHVIFFLLVVMIFSSCAARKNNWFTRHYHAMVTKYNIYFNGHESYKEGIKLMYETDKDDFSKIIPLYPISIKGNNASGMETTIEKCRKAIKLHSIQKKPKPNPKKAKDPKYQLFLQKEEYNPMLKEAWLLLGKAEFYKGDFMGALSTFTYIVNHFSTEKEVKLSAQIWMVRCYAEMGWIYEAEELMSKINLSEIDYKLESLYAGANADLLLKKKQYNEAIPFIKTAILREKDKRQKVRCHYVLAQLYQRKGQTNEAIEEYKLVTKQSPPHKMNFNAQLNCAQLLAGTDSKSVLKSLNKMAKSSTNKDFLDQIYYIIGNVYLTEGDEAKAIENYKLAIEKSTRNGIEKAIVQISLADMYYNKKQYILAQPYYSDAAQIMTTGDEDYQRVSLRGEILKDLATNHNTVVMQDSLQMIASLPKDQQMTIIQKVIEDLIEEEERQKQLAEEEAYKAQREAQSVSSLPIFGGSSSDWYFYNTNLISKGKGEFQRRWGNRMLEDGWRLKNKIAVADMQEVNYDDDAESDSLSVKRNVLDNKSPDYYFALLPDSPEKVNQSNKLIEEALFQMGNIYYLQLEDMDMAIETFMEYQRRFPDAENIAESYYYNYKIAQKNHQSLDVNRYRNILLENYPESKYAKILSSSDSTDSESKMYAQQDSVYEMTYLAYSQSNYEQVFANYKYAEENFPMSKLLPKFAFLNALSVGKTKDSELFRATLSQLVERYPQSDVTAVAKDILALMSQGKEAQKGTTHGSLLTRREELIHEDLEKEKQEKSFFSETKVPYMIVYKLSFGEEESNELIYDIAAFNFTKFMIKDYDLKLQKVSNDQYLLLITRFENQKEAIWYNDILQKESFVKGRLNFSVNDLYFISTDNYNLIGNPFSWEDYENFIKENQ